MNFIDELIGNRVLITSALAWLVAGVIKTIIEFLMFKKLDLRRIFGAGGMPSSHTSTVVALAISIGYVSGINSVDFALAVIFAIVVIHDAIGVRLETGKQAKVLNLMMFESEAFKDLDFERKLKEYVGHTPLQALAGAVVGAFTAAISLSLF